MFYDALDMSLDAFTTQLRTWEERVETLRKQMTDRADAFSVQHKNRRAEQSKNWANMTQKERSRHEADLNRIEQQQRCLFVQPIGNLSPSEQSLSWPQVQQLMDQGTRMGAS